MPRERFDINESIESLVAEMNAFESEYGMSTVEFYARFVVGKMGDSRDFIKWAGAFRLYQPKQQPDYVNERKSPMERDAAARPLRRNRSGRRRLSLELSGLA
jgi:hypothetical protein